MSLGDMTPTIPQPKPVPQNMRICVLCNTYRPITMGWYVRRIYGLMTLVCAHHATAE